VIPSVLLDDIVRRALAEDLASGDVTTEAVVTESAIAVADAVAKAPLVVCGGDVFARAFYAVDPGVRVEQLAQEGSRVAPGTRLFRAEGAARSLLMAERVALNFLQRMSGIATLTRRYVDALPAESSTRIVDTRKTTPGLRILERYAVRVGGGRNHRDHLGAAVMIKDNHIAAAGSITEAVRRVRAKAPHTSRIEVEVTSLAELEEALAARVEIVLLDNFEGAALVEAVALGRDRALLEVSGGVTLERIGELGRLGVDVISVGALTHSAPAADISLRLELLESAAP
jgi:nicotinate-nucleotide pyrophosphorylase (carboxylating)